MAYRLSPFALVFAICGCLEGGGAHPPPRTDFGSAGPSMGPTGKTGEMLPVSRWGQFTISGLYRSNQVGSGIISGERVLVERGGSLSFFGERPGESVWSGYGYYNFSEFQRKSRAECADRSNPDCAYFSAESPLFGVCFKDALSKEHVFVVTAGKTIYHLISYKEFEHYSYEDSSISTATGLAIMANGDAYFSWADGSLWKTSLASGLNQNRLVLVKASDGVEALKESDFVFQQGADGFFVYRSGVRQLRSISSMGKVLGSWTLPRDFEVVSRIGLRPFVYQDGQGVFSVDKKNRLWRFYANSSFDMTSEIVCDSLMDGTYVFDNIIIGRNGDIAVWFSSPIDDGKLVYIKAS